MYISKKTIFKKLFKNIENGIKYSLDNSNVENFYQMELIN
jgi:hypothetical protein